MMLSPRTLRAWSPMNELLRFTNDLAPQHLLFPHFTTSRTDEAVSVRAEIPGYSSADVSVSIEGERLTIAGELPKRETPEGATNANDPTHKFERVFTLPYRVDAERAVAKVEHGILQLDIPRASDELPRRIEIKAS